MAEKSEQGSATFGPEWLSFSQQSGTNYYQSSLSKKSHSNHIISTNILYKGDDASRFNSLPPSAVQTRPLGFYSSKDKEKTPLRFIGRSKSSPLIVDPEVSWFLLFIRNDRKIPFLLSSGSSSPMRGKWMNTSFSKEFVSCFPNNRNYQIFMILIPDKPQPTQ